jgi:hypothetical protein
MRRNRITERDLTRIVKRVINEMVVTEQPVHCTEKDFKESKITNANAFGIAKILALLTNPKTKFQVTGFFGSPELNGKEIKIGMIITPRTTISLCQSQTILISGMGYPEAEIYYDNGNIMFNPQHA